MPATFSTWSRRLRGPLITYALLGFALWPVPLLNRLHVESAAVIATVAYFAAGLSARARFRAGAQLKTVLLEQEACLTIPWMLLTVTLFWAPNCGYLLGLLFFLLFPVVTVVFAVSLVYLLHALLERGVRRLFVTIGVGILIGGPLYDLGLHPQLYTYNHLFGGVLGPIYDDQLAVRSGLFVFRGLTLLWAAFFVLAGRCVRFQQTTLEAKRKNEERKGAKNRAPREAKEEAAFIENAVVHPSSCQSGALGVALLIGLCYLFSARLGINTPTWYLQQQLGGRLRTEHFDIYYAPEDTPDKALTRMARANEFQYDRLAHVLKRAPQKRIRTYLYPSPSVKARLTGARRTSVTPVWLAVPQMHLLRSEARHSLSHEMAHVFSRSFGLPILHASVAVGLVEGLAVALESPKGSPSPSEKVVASALQGGGPLNKNLARGIKTRMQPLGFWTGRGAVSYAAAGSFVSYLIDAYGPGPLRRAYAWANFERVYGKPLRVLAKDWADRVMTKQNHTPWDAGPVVRAQFSVPSLFEERCPHHVPSYRKAYRAAHAALAKEDTTGALLQLRESLQGWPRYSEALALWAEVQLAQGHAERVRSRLGRLPKGKLTTPLKARLGDAEALTGHPAAARRSYEGAQKRLPLYAHRLHARLELRRAVAGRKCVIRILTSVLTPSEQAKSLKRQAKGPEAVAIRVLRALRLAQSGSNGKAARILRSDTALLAFADLAPGARSSMERQVIVWRSHIAYRSNRIQDALRLAHAAIERYEAVGDRNSAHRLRAFRCKLTWIHPAPKE